ncbi:MAG TPA: hypothetical protein VGJ03_15855 [Acidimicrobiales bacterium]
MLTSLVAFAGLAFALPGAQAAPTWAPAATAAIHPGVQTFTAGAQCTANFIYTDGTNVYIGQAAHCAGTGGNTETDGCSSGTLPVGTPVDVTGASQPGTIVYSSWATMQGNGETDANTCAFNDLALIQLSAADAAKVNPSVPFWGGPTGLDNSGTTQGESVYSYGNSELRGGATVLSPKEGTSLGDDPSGWSHNVVTASPGIPGDSGSGFLSSNGAALGILSTLQIAPTPGANGVGDLSKELAYMHSHSSFSGVQLALGTQPFNGSQAPADLSGNPLPLGLLNLI